MKKQLLFLLSLFYFLFSCSKKEKTNIEKKWVATVNTDYKLLTTPEDSLSYRWEGGNFEGVIHGKGKLYAYYGDSLVSTKGIEAYYGAIRQEDIISSGENKYIGSIKEKKFSGFGVWVKPNELYIGEFVENHPNGYLIYYKDGKRSYIGMWEHGKRTGRGTNYGEDGKIVSGIWKDNAIFELDTTLTTEKGIFKGLLRNSFPQGYGEMNYFSGSQYKGDWNNGKMEGEGIFTTATDTLIGEWKDGKLNGYGLCKTPSFLFEGDLKDNKPEGMGYIFFTDSTFYSGGWANGKMNGYGDITLSNGDTYMGNWKDDQYHGGGCYTYHTGETYDGYWKEGLQDSLGTYTCKDYTYKGQWEEGWINGQGKITYSNGDYYEGDFVENQKYGIGYYHFNNGNAYDGEFVDNKFNGLGIFTFKNGSRYQGEFRDGKIKGDGTLFLKEGKETIAITANWDGSTKFPKAASVLFENGDLYEGELDSAGFPTKNGVWTSAEDREKGITTFEKTLSRANEFYKKHRDTWNNAVLYTSLALTGVEWASKGAAVVIAFTPLAPLAPAVYGIGVAAGTINTALNTVDAAIAIASASVDIYEGIRDDDPEKTKEGGKTLVKEVAINAAFIFAPKILKSKPARKLTKKLSEVAIKVGKPFVVFTKGKSFQKILELTKNAEGVITKNWAVARTVKNVGERLSDVIQYSFKKAVAKNDEVRRKFENLVRIEKFIYSYKGSKNIDLRKKLNEKWKLNIPYNIGDNQYYMRDKFGRIDNIITELDFKKKRDWLGKTSAGVSMSEDRGEYLMTNVFKDVGGQVNHVPMLTNLNGGVYKNMENVLVKASKEGKEVFIDIKILYKKGVEHPDKFIIHYTIDRVPYKRVFSNRLGAIKRGKATTQKNIVHNVAKIEDYLSGFDETFINYIRGLSNTQTNPNNIKKVYRVMRKDQVLDKAIKPKNTTGLTKAGTPFTIEGHVGKGSTTETPYISAFTDRNKALERAKKDGNLTVVEIDLDKVEGKFVDLSTKEVREKYIVNPRNRNFAQSSSEFLIITNEIKTEAFKKIN